MMSEAVIGGRLDERLENLFGFLDIPFQYIGFSEHGGDTRMARIEPKSGLRLFNRKIRRSLTQVHSR